MSVFVWFPQNWGLGGDPGSYSYVCDGATPVSPVLSDGHTTFTAGLSSTVAGVTAFRHEDALGSLRYLTDAGQNVLGSSVYEAFGAAVGATGSTAGVPFGWVGGADCQTEADTGLVLMGHRYYDSRVGRFISQDPAGDGDNWYAYCRNSPVNATDPTGLSEGLPWDTSAPDRRYGGLGGYLGAGGEGLDDFFGDEDNTMARGEQGYRDAVAASAAQAEAQKVLFFLSAAKYLNDPTVSASYGISISGGMVRITLSGGFAVDLKTGKMEFFIQKGKFAGLGYGASSGLNFTAGIDKLGNFSGFNGRSSNFDLISGSHGFGGLEWNSGYRGLEFSPPAIGPFKYTNFGNENGIYYGTSNTIPIGGQFQPVLPPSAYLHL